MAESLEDTHDISDKDFVKVTVSTGRILEYVVATLWEVKLQWEKADETIHIFDGFARQRELLNEQTTPAVAKIMFNYDSNHILTYLNSNVGL